MLRTLFVLTVFTAGVSAALFNRFAALLLYVWFALFRPQEWAWMDVSVFRLSLVAGIILVLPALLTGVYPNLTHPLTVASALFLLFAAIAHLGAANPDLSLMWLDFTARLILISLLAVTLTTTRARFVMLVGVMAVSFGFHSAKAGFMSILGGGVQFMAGLAGAFRDNNAYAIGAVMTMFLLIASAQNVPKQWPGRRLIAAGLWVAAPLSAMTVVSTFSRSGLLALISGVLVFTLLQRRKATAALIVAALVAIGLYAVPLPAGYFNRVESIQTYEETNDTSALGRIHFWQVALDIAADHPFGVGLWGFESVYDAYDTSDGAFGIRRAVHNSHLQVLTDVGWGGAVLWVMLFGMALLTLRRVRRRSRLPDLDPEDARFLLTSANAIIASIAAFLVGGTFISMALNDLTWMTFALVASLDRLSVAMAVAPVAAPAEEQPELTSMEWASIARRSTA